MIELLLKIEEKQVLNNLMKFYSEEWLTDFTEKDLINDIHKENLANTARNDLSAIINYNYCPGDVEIYKSKEETLLKIKEIANNYTNCDDLGRFIEDRHVRHALEEVAKAFQEILNLIEDL